MSELDSRGLAITGATPAALALYESALAATLAWRSGASTPLEQAMAQAPAFVMPHILQAYTLLCSRDPKRVRSAQAVLEHAAVLPANEREATHLAAIAGVLADDYDFARETLAELLRQHPHDALALHAAHAFDYLTGDTERLSRRLAEVLPAWSDGMPGHHAVLSMHAFGLVECGDCEGAESVARAALASNPLDARAHHVMAHVFEMTGRAAAGVRWMDAHRACWSEDSVVATHCWWHLALFLIEVGRVDDALAIYDQRVRPGRPGGVADLIDASALLWRLQLRGHDVGVRWEELAQAWSPRIDDAFCSFTDLHAMLAFVGAGDEASARRMERFLAVRESLPTRHGKTTRLLGLPACRALMAFGRGDHARAINLLAGLPAWVHRLGGSHAQRDVLHLTLLHAIEQVRRPIRLPGRVDSNPRPGVRRLPAIPIVIASKPIHVAARSASGE
ncbi:tetratricopeptide repeat protein [Variovorax sp. PBL-E5]|uniref:tetratricopeptide repeat protein n=1 Tax=Variovorax sp. PBL-E5 TaxID=434014 RepID=UPI00131614E6|nr:tetratricopeptide repeat protein [Variovorax sp. PBL-E5]VTU39669.1 putative PEP-CTERM system TPR-repeat lipoprotein [Variovorax sp. PBL-E5]